MSSLFPDLMNLSALCVCVCAIVVLQAHKNANPETKTHTFRQPPKMNQSNYPCSRVGCRRILRWYGLMSPVRTPNMCANKRNREQSNRSSTDSPNLFAHTALGSERNTHHLICSARVKQNNNNKVLTENVQSKGTQRISRLGQTAAPSALDRGRFIVFGAHLLVSGDEASIGFG